MLVISKMGTNSTQKVVRGTAKFLIIMINTEEANMQQCGRYTRETEGTLHESPLTIPHLTFSCSNGLKHIYELRRQKIMSSRTFTIVSRIGDEKYKVTPCRLLRIMNSYGSCPEMLYMSLTSLNEIISVDLHANEGE